MQGLYLQASKKSGAVVHTTIILFVEVFMIPQRYSCRDVLFWSHVAVVILSSFEDGSFNPYVLILRPRDLWIFFPPHSLLFFALLNTVISSLAAYQRFEVVWLQGILLHIQFLLQ